MALKDTVANLRSLLEGLSHNLNKAENGNRAAAQRVRTQSIKLEKVAKLFRKESVQAEKSGEFKKLKKAAKKTPKAKSTTSKKAAKSKKVAPRKAKSKVAKKSGSKKTSARKSPVKRRATVKSAKRKSTGARKR